VAYHWIDPAKASTTQFGFIAQQVQPILPNLVSTTSPTALTPNGTLGLNYLGFIAPLVKAFQTVYQDVISLENTVAGFAQNFTTRQLTAHQLTAYDICLTKSDGSQVCVTGDKLAAVLSGTQGIPAQGSENTTAPAVSLATSTPPVIQVNGGNPSIIHIGDTYNDLGATITGPATDLTLGIQTFVGTTPVNQAVIDTSSPGKYRTYYVVTDALGNTSTSTRIVIVRSLQDDKDTTPPTDASSTPSLATSSTTPIVEPAQSGTSTPE
jgi:hypothetical protein